MKHPLLPYLAILCLLSACAGTAPGPDDAQKTRLSEHAAHWAEYYNTSSWDKLPRLYDDSFDFNGTRIPRGRAIQIMRDFRADDPQFQVAIQSGDWVLDSMKGDVYAGHLKGKAFYDHKSLEMPTEVILWMKMTGDNPPIIISQYDQLALAKSQLQRRYKEREMENVDFDSEGMPNFTFWEALVQKIRPRLGTLRYCSKYGDKRVIYAMGIKNATKMGVFDEYGRVILHCAYDDIGGIGTLAPGVVEVMADGQYGVMKMDGSTVLPVEFDAILPAQRGTAARYYAQAEGVWMSYDSSGHPLENNEFENLDWVVYLKGLQNQFHQAPLAGFVGEDDNEVLSDVNLFRAPFTLAKRKILEDSYGFTGEYYDGMDGGTSHLISEVAKSRDGNIRIVSVIESWGIGGRAEYHDSESKWIVFDKDMNNVLQSTSLAVDNIPDWTANNGGQTEVLCGNSDWHLIGDTVIEVECIQDALGYSAMPRLLFYKVKDSGELDTIMPQRQFPFMSLVEVKDKMLYGCFMSSSTPEEAEAWYQSQKGQKDELVENQYKEGELASVLIRTANHFRASDLDYLVNEVYAYHGFIFQSAKWQDYYHKQPWYNPTNSNVEGLLTPLERANIDLVKTIQKEMKGNEEKYTKPSFEFTSGFYGG